MENYLILIVAVLTFVPIVVGILLGLLRGSRRALLRLLLVLLSAVVAFALCGVVANSLVTLDISGLVGGEGEDPLTVVDVLQQYLGESFKDVSTYLVPFAQSLVKILSFLVLFLLLQLLTWAIVYPLCKLFVKPRRVRDGGGHTRKKKRRLLGAAFGLVQGVAVALCLFIVTNGFLSQASALVYTLDGIADASEDEGEQDEMAALVAMLEAKGGFRDAEGDVEQTEGESDFSFDSLKRTFDAYNVSIFGVLYESIGEQPFVFLSQVETDHGPVTFPGQVEALSCLIEIGKEFSQIRDLHFNRLYEDDNIDRLTTILNNVQDIREDLSDEARFTVNGLISALKGVFDIDDSLIVDFDNIDFAQQGEIFKRLRDFRNKADNQITHEEAKQLVKDIAESPMMLDMLESQDNTDLGNGLNAKHLAEIESSIDELVASGEISQELAQRMRYIFDVNNNR